MLEKPGNPSYPILDDHSTVDEDVAARAQESLEEKLNRGRTRPPIKEEEVELLHGTCYGSLEVVHVQIGDTIDRQLKALGCGRLVHRDDLLSIVARLSCPVSPMTNNAGLEGRIHLPSEHVDAISFEHICYLLRGLRAPCIIFRHDKGKLYRFENVRHLARTTIIFRYLDEDDTWFLLQSPDELQLNNVSKETNLAKQREESISRSMSSRIERLCIAIDSLKSGEICASDVCQIHLATFPSRDLPRFLLDHANDHGNVNVSNSGTLGLYDCRRVNAFIKQTNYFLLRELRTLQKLTPAVMLRHLLRLYRRDSDSQHFWRVLIEFNISWPVRNPGTQKKHNLNVLDVLRIGSVSVSHDHFVLLALFAIRHMSSNTEFVASVLLWLVCLEIDEVAWKALLLTEFWRWTEDKWVEESKRYHDRWRKYGVKDADGLIANDASWTQLLYMQSLYGRGGIEVDWTQEFSNKASVPENILEYTGDGWSATAASATIRETMSEVMATAFPNASPRPFDEFMDNAYEWLVSGSSAGIPSVLRHSKMRHVILVEHQLHPRPTKRSVMEQIPRSKIVEILQTAPKVVSKAHMKLNETGGKARAIYGVTIWHYIYSNWLMAPVERYIRHANVDIGLPNIDFVGLMLNRSEFARQGSVFSSYDYPDFNAMHSHAHMACIYELARDLALGTSTFRALPESDKDLIRRTFQWLRDSTYRQLVIHPESSELIQTCGGLYSGNRDTTLINTLLNVAYAKVVDKSLLAMQCSPRVRMRLCHGDDIVSVFGDYPTAVAWNEVAGHCRLKGQEKKLLTDQSYHEYLRVMGCKDGVLRGCLARCIATFVNGNWETDRTVGLGQKAQEIYANISTMYRRGASAETCQHIWQAAFAYFCQKIERLEAHSDGLWEYVSGLRADFPIDVAHDSKAQSDKELTFRTLPSFVTLPYLRDVLSKIPSSIEISPASVVRMLDYLQKGTYGTELVVNFQDSDLLTGIVDLPKLAFNKNAFADQPRKMTFEQCCTLVDSIPLENRLKRRIAAIYSVLKCLRLSTAQELDVLATVTEASQSTVLRVLEAEGMVKSISIVDYDAAPELKALESSVLWTQIVSDKYAQYRDTIEICFVNCDYCYRPLRELLRY